MKIISETKKGIFTTENCDTNRPPIPPAVGRRLIDETEAARLASRLARKLASFSPKRVIYIENGGRTAGEAVARALEIPASGLDIGYPMSRFGRASTRFLLLPIKELAYRLTSPRLRHAVPPFPSGERLALVDDSASSGKTLRAAFRVLRQMGVDNELIKVAVIRCGKKARPYVDHFEVAEPVLFVGR